MRNINEVNAGWKINDTGVTKFWINFLGRTQNAIGIFYPITIICETTKGALSREDAGQEIHKAGYEYNNIMEIKEIV